MLRRRRWLFNGNVLPQSLEPTVRHVTLGGMRVLAIDASLRCSGVAIIQADGSKLTTLHFGTIQNAGSLRPSSCLVAIHDRLAELIHEHEPDCCALESVIYVQSYKTAIALGRGARRGHFGGSGARPAGLRIRTRANQTMHRRPRRRRQGTGGVHGARAAWVDRNTRTRCRRCARDRADPLAFTGNRAVRRADRSANMNVRRDARPRGQDMGKQVPPLTRALAWTGRLCGGARPPGRAGRAQTRR